MSEQKHECQDSSCTKESCEGCTQNTSNKNKFAVDMNEYSSVKHVIGVASGKGGVGKSFVTAMLAVLLNRKGYKTGILDADITGPSIPKMFGIKGKARANEMGILPEHTANDIKIMSVNLLLEREEDPVLWRGPILAGTVKQFWSDVAWGELDYLLIDMPPGTGDVPLTVFQSLPLDGVVIVFSPQDLVSMIVKKAVNMAKQMKIPVLGLVENMSYVLCPDCKTKVNIFGESKIQDIADELGVPSLGRIPIDPAISALVDIGEFERFDCDDLDHAVRILETIDKGIDEL